MKRRTADVDGEGSRTVLMTETMRWFDPSGRRDIRQAEAAGVVTRLHRIRDEPVQPQHDVVPSRGKIAAARQVWPLVETYRSSLIDIAACGIRTVPRILTRVIGWARTNLARVPTPSSGLCSCAGSSVACEDSDLRGVVDRIGSLHLRSVQGEPDFALRNAAHLVGATHIFQPHEERPIPMRPDHGHQMLDDLSNYTLSRYSPIERMGDVAELSGLERTIAQRGARS
jgi:D-mannonate dehydratase